jgi:hypothetical protein
MTTKQSSTTELAAAYVTHLLCYAGHAGNNIDLAAESQEQAKTSDVGDLSAGQGQSDVTPETPMETVAYSNQSLPIIRPSGTNRLNHKESI